MSDRSIHHSCDCHASSMKAKHHWGDRREADGDRAVFARPWASRPRRRADDPPAPPVKICRALPFRRPAKASSESSRSPGLHATRWVTGRTAAVWLCAGAQSSFLGFKAFVYSVDLGRLPPGVSARDPTARTREGGEEWQASR